MCPPCGPRPNQIAPATCHLLVSPWSLVPAPCVHGDACLPAPVKSPGLLTVSLRHLLGVPGFLLVCRLRQVFVFARPLFQSCVCISREVWTVVDWHSHSHRELWTVAADTGPSALDRGPSFLLPR